MPRVSIILTSFNHGKYLSAAIESTLTQTFEDYELIIWDDASTDNSWSIIKSFSDPRIQAFRNDRGRRGIYGINKAINEIATGEYIAIHHSDDVWERNKLEQQVAFLDLHPENGAVFSDAMAIGEEGSPLPNDSHFYKNIFNQENRSRHQWLNFFFYHGNALCHPSALIRKRCFDDCGLYRYGLGQVGDLDMWMRICLRHEIYVLPQKLVRFRVRDNEANTSGNRTDTIYRTQLEQRQILGNYLKVDNFSDMVAIFPNAKKFQNSEGFEPLFVLAMMAIDNKAPSWAKLFGFDLLFKLVADETKAKRIAELYSFDYTDLISLTGGADTGSIELFHSLRAELSACQNQLDRINRHPISGPLLKLLRLVKRDQGFGNRS